ncbi:hypothetical protein DFAR_100001 [Desulfarculales bacterium]
MDSLDHSAFDQVAYHLSLAAWSLSNLAAMLRLNFFTYRELRAWLQHSYHTPPLMPEQVQLSLLPWLGQTTASETKNTNPKIVI